MDKPTRMNGQTNEDADLVNLNIIMDRANINKVVEDVNGMIATDNENHELNVVIDHCHRVKIRQGIG